MAQQIDFSQAYGRKSPIAALGEGVGQGLQIAQQRNEYQLQLQGLRQKQQEQNQKDVLSALDLMGKMPQSARPGTYTNVVLPAAKKAGIELPSEYQQDYNPLFDDASKLIDQKKQNKIDDKTLQFGLTQIQLQFAKMGDYKSADLISGINKGSGQQEIGAAQSAKLEESRQRRSESIIGKFNAEPSVKKNIQAIDFAENTISLVASGNPIAANAIPTYMARASGEVGALAEGDKKPFGGSRAIFARLEQAFTQAASGKLTPDNQKFLNELSDTMKANAERNMDRLARERAKQYSAGSNIFSGPEELFQSLRPNSIYTEEKKGRNLPSLDSFNR